MNAKYLIRLDDACQTMNHDKWAKMENILNKYSIKPIVAVIPNNKDTSFDNYQISDESFWKLVRAWQKKGWIIAQHGYTHVYSSTNPGPFMKTNKYSEFAGLTYESQKEKIKNGNKIFINNKITVKTWVAPAHTFDYNTLKAIKEETNIEIISDGVALYPYIHADFKWIPVQIPKFIKLPFGYWTICLHPNEMSNKDFDALENSLNIFNKNFITIDEIIFFNSLKYKSINFIFRIVYNAILTYKLMTK